MVNYQLMRGGTPRGFQNITNAYRTCCGHRVRSLLRLLLSLHREVRFVTGSTMNVSNLAKHGHIDGVRAQQQSTGIHGAHAASTTYRWYGQQGWSRGPAPSQLHLLLLLSLLLPLLL